MLNDYRPAWLKRAKPFSSFSNFLVLALQLGANSYIRYEVKLKGSTSPIPNLIIRHIVASCALRLEIRGHAHIRPPLNYWPIEC